MTSFIKTDDDK